MPASCTIYIGYDPREVAAYHVAVASIRRYWPEARIHPLMLDQLRLDGLYTRPTTGAPGSLFDTISGAPMSTEFAISRFLVPRLCNSELAIFMDCDVLARTDLRELRDRCEKEAIEDRKLALWVVKHPRHGDGGTKMDGQAQAYYGRKNWSSVMVFNTQHSAHKRLDLGTINHRPGRDLHAFCWLKDSEIAELPPEWNWLEGYSAPIEKPGPAIVHMTRGGPWLPGFDGVAYAEEWLAVWNALEPWQRDAAPLPTQAQHAAARDREGLHPVEAKPGPDGAPVLHVRGGRAFGKGLTQEIDLEAARAYGATLADAFKRGASVAQKLHGDGTAAAFRPLPTIPQGGTFGAFSVTGHLGEIYSAPLLSEPAEAEEAGDDDARHTSLDIDTTDALLAIGALSDAVDTLANKLTQVEEATERAGTTQGAKLDRLLGQSERLLNVLGRAGTMVEELEDRTSDATLRSVDAMNAVQERAGELGRQIDGGAPPALPRAALDWALGFKTWVLNFTAEGEDRDSAIREAMRYIKKVAASAGLTSAIDDAPPAGPHLTIQWREPADLITSTLEAINGAVLASSSPGLEPHHAELVRLRDLITPVLTQDKHSGQPAAPDPEMAEPVPPPPGVVPAGYETIGAARLLVAVNGGIEMIAQPGTVTFANHVQQIEAQHDGQEWVGLDWLYRHTPMGERSTFVIPQPIYAVSSRGNVEIPEMLIGAVFKPLMRPLSHPQAGLCHIVNPHHPSYLELKASATHIWRGPNRGWMPINGHSGF